MLKESLFKDVGQTPLAPGLIKSSPNQTVSSAMSLKTQVGHWWGIEVVETVKDFENQNMLKFK